MKKKKHKRIYTYQCSITHENYKVGAVATNPNELMSVSAYYQLHPEFDDRPEIIKLHLKDQISNPNTSSSGSEDDENTVA